MVKLSVVIPSYNEERNIPLILERFSEAMNRNDIEIVLVNNGSSDNSIQVLQDLLPKYHFAKQVHLEVNQGYGYGILAGLKETTGEYLGWTHADMQTNPMDVFKALSIIEESGNPGNIYIKGYRKKRPIFDQFFTIGMSLFETIYLNAKLFDINAQPNIFHRSFYNTWENPPHDFSLDLFALYSARKKQLDVKRFPVIFPQRQHGESKWNTGFSSKWKFTKRTLDFSVKLKKELNSAGK